MGIKILAKPVTFNTGKQGAEVAGRSRSIPRPTDPRLLEAQNTPASSYNEKRVKHGANLYQRKEDFLRRSLQGG